MRIDRCVFRPRPNALGVKFASSPALGWNKIQTPPSALVKSFIIATLLWGLASPARAQIRLPGGTNIPVPQRRGSQTQQRTNTRSNQLGLERNCPKLIEWQQQLQREYPNVNFSGTPVDKIEIMAVPLFADEAFVPYFDRSYTQLSPADLQHLLHERVQACAVSTEYRSQLQVVATSLIYAFNSILTTHTLSPNRLVPELNQLAQSRAALKQLSDSVVAMPASVETYNQLHELQNKEPQKFQFLWPRERVAAEAAIAAGIARSAESALATKMALLLSAGNSYESLKALKLAPEEYKDLFSAVTPQRRADYQSRIDAKYAAGMKVLLAEQRGEAVRFPATSQGLQDGADWYRRFSEHFGKEPSAEQISAEFRKHRNSQFVSLEPELKSKILAAKTFDQMSSVLASAFPLEQDRACSAYSDLETVIRSRKQQALHDFDSGFPSPGNRVKSAHVAAGSKSGSGKLIHPEIVDNVYLRDFDAVPTGELYAKLYLYNMADNIASVCEGYFTKVELTDLQLDTVFKSIDTSPGGGAAALVGGLASVGQAMRDPEAYVRQQAHAVADQDQLPEEAMKDAFTVMTKHPCGSPQLGTFSRNLVAFIHNDGLPQRKTDDLLQQCQSESGSVNSRNTQNFCMCFIGVLSQSPVPRAERKALYSDFLGTARKIAAEDPADFGICGRP